MSQQQAEEFFKKLETDPNMRTRIKAGLEAVAKEEKSDVTQEKFDVTQEELSAELRKRWVATQNAHIIYSEPPGF
jgi:Nif11 domain